MNNYQKELDHRRKEHLLRSLPSVEEGIDFCSNDYLGLAKSGKYYSSRNYQSGATGSRLLGGNSLRSLEIEEKIAAYHQVEATLIYNSGYTANLGVLSCLGKRDTTLIMDELVHASLIDGARLSKANRVRFKHNDLEDLERKLQNSSQHSMVVVESIYSMDGDICPIVQVLSLCKSYGAMLVVDEAHAIGLYCEGGLIDYMKLQKEVEIRIITYGKAPGLHGAAVLGQKWLKDYQINFSRPFIFSTAPPPHTIEMISQFYDLQLELGPERALLQEIIRYFVEKRSSSSGNWLASSTQIQSIIISGNEALLEASKKLAKKGINALPIRKPSVPEGTERIRVCLHSYNTPKQIEQLFELLDG